MKEQILASTDEIVVRDLYPILVSNRRIYIVRRGSRRFTRASCKKIIQLDHLSSVRYQFCRNVGLIITSVVLFLLTLICGGLFAYLHFFDKALFDKLLIPLVVGMGLLGLLAIIFFILYFAIRKKTIWFEYPTNIMRPTKVTFKHAKLKDFNSLVSAIFVSIDKMKSPKENPFSTKQDLFI